MFNKIKKALTPSLATMIGRQISFHKRAGYSFNNEIITYIGIDHIGFNIWATLKSTHPEAGGFSDSQQIDFYKCSVGSIYEAFDALTNEVSNAKIKYPGLEFFRSLRVPEKESKKFLNNWASLDENIKAELIKTGCLERVKTIDIDEIYQSGSWVISDHHPWGYY